MPPEANVLHCEQNNLQSLTSSPALPPLMPCPLSGTEKPVLCSNSWFSGQSSLWKEVFIFFSKLAFAEASVEISPRP